MNTRNLFLAICCAGALSASAQTAPPPDLQPPGDYTVTSRDAHSRTWERPRQELDPSGQIITVTDRYVEVATGLCYRDDNGDWADSTPDFTVTSEGYAVATNCQHKVIIAPNSNPVDGIVVDFLAPDGATRLRSGVLGLNLVGPDGTALQIAAVRDTQAQQTGPAEIVFPNCFDGLKASLRIRNEIGRFHHEVLLHEKLTSQQLASLGFADPASVRLEVWTEFASGAQPGTRATQADGSTAGQPAGADTPIDFGTVRMGDGSAFLEGEAAGSVPISKEWYNDNDSGRAFLIESAGWGDLAPLVQDLPEATFSALQLPNPSRSLLAKGTINRSAPGGKTARMLANVPARSTHDPKCSFKTVLVSLARNRLAQNASPGGGTNPLSSQPAYASADTGGSFLNMDYTTLNSTQTNYLFAADSTYYISGLVTLVSNAVFEGGAVLKFPVSATAGIACTNVVCATKPYRPVIFTASTDGSCGESVATGNPSTNYWGNIALNLLGAPAGIVLSNMCFSYVSNAIAGTNITLQNVQIAKCKEALTTGSKQLTLRNVLAYNVNTLLNSSPGPANSLTAEHLTAHNCTNLLASLTGTIRLTNCLFAAVGNWQAASPNTNACAFLSSDTAVFQSVGGGSHYLADASPYRNAGVTNLTPSLLAELTNQTTFPPVLYSNVTLSTATTFSPQAQRDTDAPDLGFHYNVLDLAVSGLAITNCTVQFGEGLAVGCLVGSSSSGIALQNNGVLTSRGSALRLNRLVPNRCVQELPVPWSYGPLNNSISLGTGYLNLDFCELVMPGCTNLYHVTGLPLSGRLNNCQLSGGAISVVEWGGGVSTVFAVTNSLLERVRCDIMDYAFQYYIAHLVAHLKNNLFKGGFLSFNNRYTDSAYWYANNNIFDGTAGFITNAINSYNGYVNGATLTHTSIDQGYNVTPASFTYATGPLGNWYQSSTNMINAGNVTADALGLYHFTALTNNVKETNSVVDIGFHYVAVGGNGIPLDYDSDGTADYIEDANGNGSVDTGETDWRTYNSRNGLSGSVLFQVFTPLR